MFYILAGKSYILASICYILAGVGCMQVSIYAGLLRILVSLSENQCLLNRKDCSGARLKPSKLTLEYYFSIY
jgi:hypothetical protein